MSLHAIIEPLGGRAVIFEDGTPIHTIEVDKPEPESAKGLHLGMYLQPAMSQLIDEPEVDPYPYPKLREKLGLLHRQRRSLTCFVTSIDPKMSMEIRTDFAQWLAELLEEPAVEEWLKSIVVPVGIAEGGDLAGLPHEAVRAKIEGWLAPQPSTS